MHIPYEQHHDPLLQDALKEAGAYKALKIKACFKKYNMIIYTSQGIIDTSIYNLCNVVTKPTLDTNIGSNDAGDILILAYNPKPDSQGDAQKIDGHEFTTKYRMIEISEKSIQKIIIKSFRNFLPNQNPKAK